jgi:hypothetical protein
LVAEAPQDGKNGTVLSARVAPRQPGPRQPGGRGVQYLKSNVQVSGNAAWDSRELDNEEKFASREYRTSWRRGGGQKITTRFLDIVFPKPGS